MAVVEFIVLGFHPSIPDAEHIAPPEKASRVRGRMQTAVVESSGVANPRVPVLKLWVVSLSPTFAGRDLTLCRLKSHMAEELLSCERPTNPDPLAKNGPISQHGFGHKATQSLPCGTAQQCCPRRAGLPAQCGSSLQRTDAGVWLVEYPGLSFQHCSGRACSLVSSKSQIC